MARTLLQIIQAAQGELGLAQDTVVISSQQQTTIQMFGYANQEVEDLRQRHNWTALTKQNIVIVNPPTTVTGNLTQNSAVVTSITPNTNGLLANFMTVTGTGIPTAARILSVDSSSQVTLDMECTGASATGVSLVFSQDTYPEPADFAFFNNRTWWDRTNHWELLGPASPQLDQWHQSGIIATGPRRYFRQIGALANVYRLWPPPSEIVNPLQLVFEYVSKQPVFVNGGTTTAEFWANDGDTCILDSRAIINGIKWRFWEQKGFDWTQKRTDYDNYVERLIARDGGKETLQMTKRMNPIFISPANVQDGFFPGPVGPNQG